MTTGSINPLAGYNPPEIYPPSPLDTVEIGGQTCPGICTWHGWGRKYKWDAKGGKGAQGETLTYTMRHAARGTFRFWLYAGLHFVLWEGFRPAFLYDPTKQPNTQAVSIFHPCLADLGIGSVICESLTAAAPQGAGLWMIEAELAEWNPVPKGAAVATPTAAQSGRNGPVVNPQAPDATNPLITKIESLATQFQQT